MANHLKTLSTDTLVPPSDDLTDPATGNFITDNTGTAVTPPPTPAFPLVLMMRLRIHAP